MVTAEDLRRNSLHYSSSGRHLQDGPGLRPRVCSGFEGKIHGVEGLHVVDASINEACSPTDLHSVARCGPASEAPWKRLYCVVRPLTSRFT